ncbi:unnamed protein product [Cyclocybe aegerita]|uniref:XPG-I domain-containing protein n=1 Tax=Cyclocybe aegerita TaxID=1973307 RepID=A0A8S0WDA7_CYCAE|nr:unnamed protein product [Cyclocybe aegerita]
MDQGLKPGRTQFFRFSSIVSVELLAAPIIPIFVFDGAGQPSQKRGKNVKKKPHWLSGRFQLFIEAFGFSWYTAPGEAEAELAMLNMMGMIDAIISEDSDCLVFGGLCVIRLQNTKDAGDQVTIITADAARSHTRVSLTREEYASRDSAALELPKGKLVDFLADWREDFKLLLADDPMGLLGQRYPALVKAVGNTFPSADVVALYAQPVTSWSCGRAPDTSNWTLRLPDLRRIGALSEKLFSLASQDNIFSTFSSNVWEGILVRDLLKRAVNPDPTPGYTNNGFYSGHILKIRGIKLGPGPTRYHPDVPGFCLSVSAHMLAHDTILALPNDCNKPECPPGLQVMNAWVPLQILETALLALVQHYFTAHPTAVIVQHWTSILPDVAVPGDDDNDTSSVSSTPLSSGSDTEIPVAGPSDTHGSSSHNAIVIMDDNEDGDVDSDSDLPFSPFVESSSHTTGRRQSPTIFLGMIDLCTPSPSP